jgi:hypothetical protein
MPQLRFNFAFYQKIIFAIPTGGQNPLKNKAKIFFDFLKKRLELSEHVPIK